jgi:hypothetical protein
MSCKKVIIFGFPHCGTSIIKSIIGHIENVYEVIDETYIVDERIFNDIKSKYKYILIKYPHIIFPDNLDIFGKEYVDYIKIFIIRNPLFVFSSLNKRTNGNIPVEWNHNISNYSEVAAKFDYYRTNKTNNMHLIRYEELFEKNYLKDLLDLIGFNYTDKIFENKHYINNISSNLKNTIISSKPSNIHHTRYRTWQINQEFKNNNDISKLDLHQNQINEIISDLNIQKVYPDIKSYLKI